MMKRLGVAASSGRSAPRAMRRECGQEKEKEAFKECLSRNEPWNILKFEIETNLSKPVRGGAKNCQE